MGRVVKEIIKNVPENVQPVLERNHLNMLLGLKVDSAIKPKLGNTWNVIVTFPNFSSSARRAASSQGVS